MTLCLDKAVAEVGLKNKRRKNGKAGQSQAANGKKNNGLNGHI